MACEGLSIKPAERGWCHTHAMGFIGKDLSDPPGRIKSLFSSLCLAWLEPWCVGGIEGTDSALQLVQICQQCLLTVHTNPLSKPLATDRISFPAKAHRPFQRHFNLKALLFFFFLFGSAGKQTQSFLCSHIPGKCLPLSYTPTQGPAPLQPSLTFSQRSEFLC